MAATENHLTGKNIIEQLDKYMDMSSDDYDSDLESDDGNNSKRLDLSKIANNASISTSYRYVRRLNSKFPLNKMKSDEFYRTYFLKNYADMFNLPDTPEVVIEDDDVDDDDSDVIMESSSNEQKQEHNYDETRQKVDEFDRQQIKGIQFANAGSNNIKIVNNHAVTSNTCILM